MSLISLIVFLMLISGATYLAIDGIRLYLRSTKRSDLIVNEEHTAPEADVRPVQVVIPEQAKVATAPLVDATPTSFVLEPKALEAESTSTMLNNLHDWRQYDEPACLRKCGTFVFA
ncbi:hypothetical protein [Eoetvoesiella caeni]